MAIVSGHACLRPSLRMASLGSLREGRFSLDTDTRRVMQRVHG